MENPLHWLGGLFGQDRRPEAEDALTLLALTESSADSTALREIGGREHWDVSTCATLAEAETLLKHRKFAVILSDREIEGSDWRVVLRTLLTLSPRSCIVLASPVNDGYLWEEVVQRGGYDVLVKPLEATQVIHSVRLAWSYWRMEQNQPSRSQR